MPKVLAAAEVEQYHRDGFYFPIRIMSQADAAGCEQKLRALEHREGGTISRKTNMKPHLLVPWLEDLVRHPKVLDAIEDIIGPNILAWGSGFFTKGAHDPSFVSWHQDSTYWGLSKPEIVTAWIAFTPSTVQSGCMKVMPGTHGEQIEHKGRRVHCVPGAHREAALAFLRVRELPLEVLAHRERRERPSCGWPVVDQVLGEGLRQVEDRKVLAHERLEPRVEAAR